MPFINDILTRHSLSIIGMEKNVGKTVTLNYILKRLSQLDTTIALTSIGIDGEGLDQVTQTPKPEIVINKGTLFTTSEKHYLTRQIVSEILSLSDYRTSLGRLVTARALTKGKCLISGPADTAHLAQLVADNKLKGIDLTIVDGALSRKSLASPIVTDAMILATGAAYSLNPKQLIKGTVFLCKLIDLPEVASQLKEMLLHLGNGVYAMNDCGEISRLNMPSAVVFSGNKGELFRCGNTLYVNGVVGDKLLDYIKMQPHCASCTIIVRDFTQLFISPEVYAAYIKNGGKIKVLHRSQLIAVTVNPTSPSGYALDSEDICSELAKHINVPVLDIIKGTSKNSPNKKTMTK